MVFYELCTLFQHPIMRLSELESGQTGVIVKILGHGAFRKRVMEMGFVRGREVTVLLHAPMHDPIKYSIMGYEVSLRKSEAHLVEVEPVEELGEPSFETPAAVVRDAEGDDCPKPEKPTDRRHHISVALIGNPNCGKTSLFNMASGAREHVGNYSGVTVDAKSGSMRYAGYTFDIVDLPGTYSLASYSPEEIYVREYLRDNVPDVIVNVVDASNLERNLYLTTELIDMDRSMVIDLNMYDELERNGVVFNYKLLGEMIGVPVVPTVSKTGQGVNELFDAVIDVYEQRHPSTRHVHITFNHDLEQSISVLKDIVKAQGHTGHHISPRYIAIKMLEHDPETERFMEQFPDSDVLFKARDTELERLSHIDDEDLASVIASEKYGFIAGALAETMRRPAVERVLPTTIIDSFVTNKLFGFPLFFAIMFLVFWLTFSVGQYPMDWMQAGVDWLSQMAHDHLPEGPLKDLVADGVIGGVGGVIVFLPNILILYFCISFMEDSGYMARAAFIMDKVMHRIGLHGKSFIPLVMGFGCNVPAIMASRTIESRSSRIITILINPFMSCSARLPIYVLLVGTFFSAYAALVFMALYCLGIVVAVITARCLRKFMFKKDETPFVMELPPYRMPTLKASLRHTWGKGEQYLRKMGGIILVASVIVWALNYFPLHRTPSEQPVAEGVIDTDHDSYLEMAGKAVNPVLEPLGFHWRASVAALAGIPAKELVVSSLGVLYTNDEAVSDASLAKRLTAPNPATGQPDFTAASALAFLAFILLYCPCVATLTAIVRETGSWRYGVFSALYNTAVAWVMAFAVYRIALLF